MLKGRIPPEQVKFHPEKFPKYKQDYIASETLKAVREFLAIPGNKEKLDLEIERMRQAGELV